MLYFHRKFSSGITLLRYDVTLVVLGLQSLPPSSRVLLEGKLVKNLIQGTWASIYEVYVVVIIATTLLLK